MKIITKKYKIYNFEELSQEAKDKAIEDFNSDNNYPFLEEFLTDFVIEELKTANYTIDDDIKLSYSLSYSQGDGLMFEGTISDKDNNTYTIKHSGYYSHERSTVISGIDNNGEMINTGDFEDTFYIPLCIKARDLGYQYIEDEQSEETFSKNCEDNDWTFLESGKMFNI